MKSIIDLNWEPQAGGIFGLADLTVNDMNIVDVSSSRCNLPGGASDMTIVAFRDVEQMVPFACLELRITLQRMIEFYITSTYLPSTLLVLISFLSFWVDAQSAPARIGLSITAMLTLTSSMNGVRSEIPIVSAFFRIFTSFRYPT